MAETPTSILSASAIDRLVNESLADARRCLELFVADRRAHETIAAMVRGLTGCFRSGNKVLICGNGGSLCDALHFAEELTGRFRNDRPPLPAIAIAEAGHITCTANDYGFAEVFARGVTALGRPGDVLIAMSTSGNSENIRRAVAAARAQKMHVFLLLGKGGGALKDATRDAGDLTLIAPGATADRIQELHMLVLHTLVEGVEAELFGAK